MEDDNKAGITSVVDQTTSEDKYTLREESKDFTTDESFVSYLNTLDTESDRTETNKNDYTSFDSEEVIHEVDKLHSSNYQYSEGQSDDSLLLTDYETFWEEYQTYNYDIKTDSSGDTYEEATYHESTQTKVTTFDGQNKILNETIHVLKHSDWVYTYTENGQTITEPGQSNTNDTYPSDPIVTPLNPVNYDSFQTLTGSQVFLESLNSSFAGTTIDSTIRLASQAASYITLDNLFDASVFLIDGHLQLLNGNIEFLEELEGILDGVWESFAGEFYYLNESIGYAIDVGAGMIDGFLDTINPVDYWWSIPDIGPIFGHQTAYTVGYVTGVVGGVASSFLIGNIAGGGSALVRCGSGLQKLAKLYTVAETVSAVAGSTHKYATTGKLDVFDVLNFASAAGAIAGGMRKLAGGGYCFVTGTSVLIVVPWPEGDLAEQHVAGESPEGLNWNPLLMVSAAIPVALLASTRLRRKREEEEEQVMAERIAALAALNDRDRILEDESWQLPGPDQDAALLQDLASQQTRSLEEVKDPRDLLFAGQNWNELLAPVSSSPDRPLVSVAARRDRPPVDVRKAEYEPASHTPAESFQPAETKRFASRRWWSLLAPLFLMLGLLSAWWTGGETPEPIAAASSTPVSAVNHSFLDAQLPSKPIEEIRLGERVIGRNPLREQVDSVEPDPVTWRKLSLHMQKENGRSLWIELLRPVQWLEATGAAPGGTIYLEMEELGAVGEAEVTAIQPCPPILPGSGTVVTGTFKHEVDAGSRVLRLQLEGQAEPTGVTANHPYWSVDRQAFVPAGELRSGETLDTPFGPRKVISSTPDEDYTGYVYNLETTEHVYRVDVLGTLVHNNYGSSGSRGTRNTLRSVTNYTDELTVSEQTARRHLRRNVPGTGGQSHHITPWQVRNHELVQRAARGGFNLNGSNNGIRLDITQHLGSHPRYNRAVLRKLDEILLTNPRISNLDAANALQRYTDQLRAGLQRSSSMLH